MKTKTTKYEISDEVLWIVAKLSTPDSKVALQNIEDDADAGDAEAIELREGFITLMSQVKQAVRGQDPGPWQLGFLLKFCN
jgi:hypothetical protein